MDKNNTSKTDSTGDKKEAKGHFPKIHYFEPDYGTGINAITKAESELGFSIIERPWGWMELLCMNKDKCSVRILNINPGHRLSFQKHNLRDEIFVALDDNLKVEIKRADSDTVQEILVSRDEYIFIPRGTFHRFTSTGELVRSLEVAFGEYFQEDIVRLEDDYGRPQKGE